MIGVIAPLRALRTAALAALLVALFSHPGAAVAAEAPPASLSAGAYLLDPDHSKVTARITFLGLARHSTSFSGVDGRLDYNPQDPDAARVLITVDPRSLSNPGSPVGREMTQLLEPDRFPTIAFRSRKLIMDQGGARLVGDLTLHGVTRVVTLDMAFRGRSGDERAGHERMALSGSGRIRRSDFGMAAMRGLVQDQVDLVFDVQFAKAGLGD